MKKLLSSLLLALALLAGAARADVTTTAANGVAQVFRGSGNTLPSSCQGNDLFWKANATSGQRIYGCESGVYVQQGGGSSGLSGVTLSGDVTNVGNAITVVTVGGNSFPSLSSLSAGGVLYASSTSGNGNIGNVVVTSALVLGNGTSAPSAYAGSSPSACANQFSRGPALSAAGVLTLSCASVAIGTDVSGLGTGVATALGVNTGSAGAMVLQGTPPSVATLVTFTTGTSRTLANPAEVVVCTSTCSVTPPATLTAGMQFCAQNDDNVTTVITLAASTSVQYESSARTSYGTANHTMTSGGALKDQICMVAISATKWNVFSAVGTWTNN